MPRIVIIVSAIIIVVILALGGWWLFSKTNSATFQMSNVPVPQSSDNNQTDGANNQASNTATTAQGSDKSITSFTLSGLTPEVDGVIDYDNYKINLNVPSGTDLTNLTPTISIPADATVSPLSGVSQDFTDSVTYTVTAQDGSTQSYTVTVMPMSD